MDNPNERHCPEGNPEYTTAGEVSVSVTDTLAVIDALEQALSGTDISYRQTELSTVVEHLKQQVLTELDRVNDND